MYGYAVAVSSFTNRIVDSASYHGTEITLTCADYRGENIRLDSKACRMTLYSVYVRHVGDNYLPAVLSKLFIST